MIQSLLEVKCMRYNVVKNADEIINNSNYLVKRPAEYKGCWNKVFNNNNPICLELGMGRGSFIIEMAKENPNVNLKNKSHDPGSVWCLPTMIPLYSKSARFVVRKYHTHIDSAYTFLLSPLVPIHIA